MNGRADALTTCQQAETDISIEHKEIADQITLIRRELEKESPDEAFVAHALRELLEITESHFRHEEDIMLIKGFPGMLLHKRDHDYLIKGLSAFTSSLVDATVKLLPGTGAGLQSWLKYLITKFDDAYLAFIQQERKQKSV
jgi:hemerythrin